MRRHIYRMLAGSMFKNINKAGSMFQNIDNEMASFVPGHPLRCVATYRADA